MLYCTFFISFEKVDLTIRLGVLPALSFGVKKKKKRHVLRVTTAARIFINFIRNA